MYTYIFLIPEKMYSKSRGDKQKKCTVHFFRLKTPENAPYIYARSPPIKGVGIENRPSIKSFLSNLKGYTVPTYCICSSVRSHRCGGCEWGFSGRPICIYPIMSGLYLAQGPLVYSSGYSKDQLIRTLVVQGKELLTAAAASSALLSLR